MKYVSFMVGAMVLASHAQGAPAHGAAEQIQEADAQLARQDVTGAQSTLRRIALALTGAIVPGREAQVAVTGALNAVPASAPQGFQAAWRRGYADARAGHYSDHRPATGDAAQDQDYQGYEAGWAAGNAPQY